eukprot:543672_1
MSAGVVWHWHVCIYTNPTSNTFCAMCATKRQISNQLKSDNNLTNWKCESCTYVNSADTSICLMCFAAYAPNTMQLKSHDCDNNQKTNWFIDTENKLKTKKKKTAMKLTIGAQRNKIKKIQQQVISYDLNGTENGTKFPIAPYYLHNPLI